MGTIPSRMSDQAKSVTPHVAGPSPDAEGIPAHVKERDSKSRRRHLGTKLLKAVALLVLCGAAFGVLAVPLGQMTSNRSDTLDFANFYTAGMILRRGQASHLYDLRLQRQIESEVSPGGPFMAYMHPPFEALFFAVLAGLSYPHAFLVWAALNLVVVGVIVFLLPFTGYRLGPGPHLIWIAICLLFVLSTLALGQDVLLLALVFLLAFLAMKRRRDFVAGLALGLGLYRFEILLPFLFILFLRRRWRVVAGAAVMGVVALSVSVVVVGLTGVLRYVQVLVQVGRGEGLWLGDKLGASAMPSLRGALDALLGRVIPHSLLFPVVLVATLLLLGWAAWQWETITRPDEPVFDLEFSLALIATMLAGYHLFMSELTPMIVTGFLILGYEGLKQRRGVFESRTGAGLLVLFLGTVGVLAAIHSQAFSVEVIVLLSLMVWLSQEISAGARNPTPHEPNA